MTSDYCSTFDEEIVTKGQCLFCDDGQYLFGHRNRVHISKVTRQKLKYTLTWGKLLQDKKPVVREGHRTCLFMGIAVNDVMTAKLIMSKAVAQNAGMMLKL